MKKILIVLGMLLVSTVAQAQSQRNPCIYVNSANTNCVSVGTSNNGVGNSPMPVGGLATASAPIYIEGMLGSLSFDLSGNLRVTSSGGGGGGAVTIADGADITQGAKADAVCGTATGTCSLAALAKFLNNAVTSAIPAGTAIIGKVGIDQTTDGTTNLVAAKQSGAWTVTSPAADPCQAVVKTFTPISITTATTTRIVAPTSAKRTYICHIFLTSVAADNIGIVEGTGGTCGTATAGVIGGTTAANGPNFTANGGVSLGNGGFAFAATAGTNVDLCLITSAATPLAGSVSWVQAP